MLVALASDDADLRRHAVAKVAAGSKVDTDWAFEGLEAIARTDKVSNVRCVSIRGLARIADERPVSAVTRILDYTSTSRDIRAPDDQVRWECLLLLERAGERGYLSEDQRIEVRDACIAHLDQRFTSDVRRTAVRALRFQADRKVLTALIGALTDPDFGVVYEAEHALAALTGVTHDYDPDAWRTWLSETDDPFALAGSLPDGVDPPNRNWWQTLTKKRS
jgi:hypothetical protein